MLFADDIGSVRDAAQRNFVDLDKELERRGHAFCRYADDCNVYVRSRRAGERVMALLRRCYAKLRLKVNETKSAVASVAGRKFLGYSFWFAKGGVKRKEMSGPRVSLFSRDRLQRDLADAWAATGVLTSGVRPSGVPLAEVQSMEQAVEKSLQLTERGDVVLLSPATAKPSPTARRSLLPPRPMAPRRRRRPRCPQLLQQSCHRRPR